MILCLVILGILLGCFQVYLWWMPTSCPLCGKESATIIYMGLPGTMCPGEDCFCMTGPASYAALVYFNGHFFVYPGSYWVGLYHWIRMDFNNPESQ